MSANATTAAPTGRKRIAQGKDAEPAADAALGHASQNTSSPEGAKEGGELPRGWNRVAIKDMADSIQYGHTASAIERKDGPRFLRITDIQDGRVDWSAVPSCDIPKDDIPKYRLSSGDLVFARTGATTGKSFLIGDCPEAVFASYLIRVRVSAGVDSRYLSAFFQSPDYWRQIEGGKRGIGQPNVNGQVLGEVQFPVAPLIEQRRIVAEIEKQFTRLEAGVAALRRVQANLKRYRAAVLKAACEGDWPQKPLGEIAEVRLGKMLDKAKHVSGRKLPYLRNVNVRWGKADTDDLREMYFKDEELERYGLKAGDVLVCEGGEPGRATVWWGHLPEMKYQKAIHRVRFNIPFEPRLLVWLLERLALTGGLERRFTGSTIKHFTREAFIELPIPVPPVAEQTRIVAEVERRLSVVEELESVVSANLQRATRLRQSILQKAFTGKLV